MRKICAVKRKRYVLKCPADNRVPCIIVLDSMRAATHNVFDRQLGDGVVDLDKSLG
jgi:hypothetical protein